VGLLDKYSFTRGYNELIGTPSVDIECVLCGLLSNSLSLTCLDHLKLMLVGRVLLVSVRVKSFGNKLCVYAGL